MPPMASSLWIRDCEGDDSAACEKPVSNFIKSGVPGIIVGVLFLIAVGVCCYFLYRNKKRDAIEAKAAQKWNDGDL
ncbi:hypothetical protein ABOM_005556 [Aspergillus bombycis]|uniref:Uncharacterized protein n=1 Tax=Aspergillus bombycis TaxID=109264 RepID=A0A1F8A0X3_9EURO|nr:hypothetical protein ABOM_005556 [Aspergillus bombycis]OGM45351.1 hypothetical protein ABOM_005556 [Aspergillus bombycis]